MSCSNIAMGHLLLSSASSLSQSASSPAAPARSMARNNSLSSLTSDAKYDEEAKKMEEKVAGELNKNLDASS